MLQLLLLLLLLLLFLFFNGPTLGYCRLGRTDLSEVFQLLQIAEQNFFRRATIVVTQPVTSK